MPCAGAAYRPASAESGFRSDCIESHALRLYFTAFSEPPDDSTRLETLSGYGRAGDPCGIGGLAKTREMLEFCAAKGVLPSIAVIAMQDVETAYDRMDGSAVKYRFVIDMATLATADEQALYV